MVAQQNLQFQPFLNVPVGADVSFPNFDPTKHHVYSFSPAKRFELKLFARDQSRTVHFDKAGVVALGCNIHDQMSAFIVVTDSGWTAQTNAPGRSGIRRRAECTGRRDRVAPISARARRARCSRRSPPAQRSASFRSGCGRPAGDADADY